MPCLVGCLAVASPRLAVFFVWLFGGGYLSRAFDSWLFPLIGFFFLPLTTLAFAYGMNSLGPAGQMTPLGWLLTALGVIFDLGLAKSGHTNADRWRRERRER